MPQTVPMAPLTNFPLTSRFLRSMTRAPTANLMTASSPAVLLQSLFSSSSLLAALRCLFSVVVVPSTSSMHGISTCSDPSRFIMSSLTFSHCFLVGKRQTGVMPELSSSWYFSVMGTSKTLSCRVATSSGVTLAWRTSLRRLAKMGSFFCRSLIVSSSYRMHLRHMLTADAHPSLTQIIFLVTFSKTGLPLTGGSCSKSPKKRTFFPPNQSLSPKISPILRCM